MQQPACLGSNKHNSNLIKVPHDSIAGFASAERNPTREHSSVNRHPNEDT